MVTSKIGCARLIISLVSGNLTPIFIVMTYNEYLKEVARVNIHNQGQALKWKKAIEDPRTTKEDLQQIRDGYKQYPMFSSLPEQTRARIAIKGIWLIQKELPGEENSSRVYYMSDPAIDAMCLVDGEGFQFDKYERFVLVINDVGRAAFGFTNRESGEVVWRQSAANMHNFIAIAPEMKL